MATAKPSAPLPPVEVISAPPAPSVEETEERAQHESMLNVMRDYFAAQPKVRIRVPKEKGNVPVQVNGYTFLIAAGEYVEVPRDVADILEAAQYI